MNKPKNKDEDADRFDECLRAPHNCSVYFGTFGNVFQQQIKLFNPSVSVCASHSREIHSVALEKYRWVHLRDILGATNQLNQSKGMIVGQPKEQSHCPPLHFFCHHQYRLYQYQYHQYCLAKFISSLTFGWYNDLGFNVNNGKDFLKPGKKTLPVAQRTQKLTPWLGLNLATTWHHLH